MYINHEDSFFFSSNDDPTTLGPALNKDLNGSRFQVRMEPPISVPTDAQSVTIECVNANILHVTPNIAAEYGNNTMYVEYDYDDGGPQTFGMTLVLTDGNYTTDTLNSEVQRLLSSYDSPPLNAQKFSPGAIIISENTATQRVIITLANNLRILTSGVNNVMPILGFTGADLESTYDGENFYADSVAQLNRVNSYLLHGDIVQGGIPLNSQQDNIFAQVDIDVPAGGNINFRPFNPLKVSGTHLKYGDKDLLTFYMTDEKNRPVNTLGENFTFTLVIRYQKPVHNNY
jgi:hypothetical protein